MFNFLFVGLYFLLLISGLSENIFFMIDNVKTIIQACFSNDLSSIHFDQIIFIVTLDFTSCYPS